MNLKRGQCCCVLAHALLKLYSWRSHQMLDYEDKATIAKYNVNLNATGELWHCILTSYRWRCPHLPQSKTSQCAGDSIMQHVGVTAEPGFSSGFKSCLVLFLSLIFFHQTDCEVCICFNMLKVSYILCRDNSCLFV